MEIILCPLCFNTKVVGKIGTQDELVCQWKSGGAGREGNHADLQHPPKESVSHLGLPRSRGRPKLTLVPVAQVKTDNGGCHWWKESFSKVAFYV